MRQSSLVHTGQSPLPEILAIVRTALRDAVSAPTDRESLDVAGAALVAVADRVRALQGRLAMCKQCEANAGALFTAAQIGVATHENAATGLSGAAAIYEAIIRLTTAADAPDNFDVIEGLARVGAQLTNTSLFAVDGWREKLDSSVRGLERAEASHG